MIKFVVAYEDGLCARFYEAVGQRWSPFEEVALTLDENDGKLEVRTKTGAAEGRESTVQCYDMRHKGVTIRRPETELGNFGGPLILDFDDDRPSLAISINADCYDIFWSLTLMETLVDKLGTVSSSVASSPPRSLPVDSMMTTDDEQLLQSQQTPDHSSIVDYVEREKSDEPMASTLSPSHSPSVDIAQSTMANEEPLLQSQRAHAQSAAVEIEKSEELIASSPSRSLPAVIAQPMLIVTVDEPLLQPQDQSVTVETGKSEDEIMELSNAIAISAVATVRSEADFTFISPILPMSKIKKRRYSSSNNLDMLPSFAVGDYVFTKVNGHPHWPSKITAVHMINRAKGLVPQYAIHFYGTNEIAIVYGDQLLPYVAYKSKLLPGKNRTDFVQAVIEIEQEMVFSLIKNQTLQYMNSDNEESDFGNAGHSAMEEDAIDLEQMDGQLNSCGSQVSVDDKKICLQDLRHFKKSNAKISRSKVFRAVGCIFKFEEKIAQLTDDKDAVNGNEMQKLLADLVDHMCSGIREAVLARPSLLHMIEMASEVQTSVESEKLAIDRLCNIMIYRIMAHSYRAADDELFPKHLPQLPSEIRPLSEQCRQRFMRSSAEVITRPGNAPFGALYTDVSIYYGPVAEEFGFVSPASSKKSSGMKKPAKKARIS